MTKTKQKELMITALRKSLGNVTVACKSVKLGRETHFRWLRTDKNYKEFIDKLPEEEIDFYEHALIKKIKSGDTTSIIFALKCKGKNRGWVDRREISLTGNINSNITATTLRDTWSKVKAEDEKQRTRSPRKPTKTNKRKRRLTKRKSTSKVSISNK